jgi:2-keto-3-deoxy-L-rhamnonate aldolase RhmA
MEAFMEEMDRIRDKIARRELVIGTHISLDDSSVTELLGDVGFDVVWIDTEHSPIDLKELQLHLIAARASQVAAWVRVAWNDPVIVKPILEMGPAGLVFPMIRTQKEAEDAVACCFYPPRGIRGYGPRRVTKYGLVGMQEYVQQAHRLFWRIMQIEHFEAVDNLDGILGVDGVDAIVVGPNDLSASIGKLGKTGDRQTGELQDAIAQKARLRRVPFGVSTGDDPKVLQEWIERGASFVFTGSDVGYIVKGGKHNLQTVTELGRRSSFLRGSDKAAQQISDPGGT